MELCRKQVRQESSDEDDLLEMYRSAAIIMAERYTGHSLVRTAHQVYVNRWPQAEEGNSLVLPIYPVHSITKVEYMADGDWEELEAGAYTADLVSKPCRLRIVAPQAADPDVEMPIRITMDAGMDYSAIPESARSGMLMLVGHLYANREDVVVAGDSTAMPHGGEWFFEEMRIIYPVI